MTSCVKIILVGLSLATIFTFIEPDFSDQIEFYFISCYIFVTMYCISLNVILYCKLSRKYNLELQLKKIPNKIGSVKFSNMILNCDGDDLIVENKPEWIEITKI